MNDFFAEARIHCFTIKNDETVKCRNSHFFVIPAQAGIQSFHWVLDAGSSPA
jgi:hypothetical protein